MTESSLCCPTPQTQYPVQPLTCCTALALLSRTSGSKRPQLKPESKWNLFKLSLMLPIIPLCGEKIKPNKTPVLGSYNPWILQLSASLSNCSGYFKMNKRSLIKGGWCCISNWTVKNHSSCTLTFSREKTAELMYFLLGRLWSLPLDTGGKTSSLSKSKSPIFLSYSH